MCPEEKCGKKVVDENNGTYRCEKCNKTYNHFKWAYMLSVGIKYFFQGCPEVEKMGEGDYPPWSRHP
jgi:hypothetical protein